jgi:D-serine deaminase-like pyridoxal phosphate-dependent protein
MSEMSTEQTWYAIDEVNQMDSPALAIYIERVKQNIELVKHMIGDPSRLRPHVKTHKSADITRLLMQAGISKFKCATIAEAEMLGMCSAPDVLLAYQLNPVKLQRFFSLIKTYPDTRFSCLIDNLDTAASLSEEAVKLGLLVDVYMDLNVGMNRTGIVPGEAAIKLYENSAGLPGLALKGLHAYDGHIHAYDVEERRAIFDRTFAPVEEMIAELKEKGHTDLRMVAGGTPTFAFHAEKKDWECSPGTFVFWDEGYLTEVPEQKFLPAALVITRVVSLPTDYLLCLDLGHKAISSENPLPQRVSFLNAPELKVVGHSEEHLMVEAGAGHHWKIGDVLYGLPFHICPTVNLYAEAETIERKKVSGKMKIIARDRKIVE